MWPPLKLAFHSRLSSAVVWEGVVQKSLRIHDSRVVEKDLGVGGSRVWRYRGL